MANISSKDVSIVVQGKNIIDHTKKCLESLRKNFPYAEIIFSTYDDEDVFGLDFDVLVQSVDPKATYLSGKMYNNINRILTTTKAGLEKVNRQYCLKIRSDLMFDNDKILSDIASQFPLRDKQYSIFKKRVLFYCLWSRKFEYIDNKYYIQTPFHLSDWLCFGLSEDIKNFFSDIPLTDEPDYSYYFKNSENRVQYMFEPNVTWKFPPEQYFTTCFFGRFFEQANMKSLQDVTVEQVELSRRIFASNVVVCGYKECGAYIQKHEYKFVSKNINWLKGVWLSGVYRYADFLSDYKKYCDKNFKIPNVYLWTLNQQIDSDAVKLSKHYKTFMQPIRVVLKWLEQFFAVVFYIIKIGFATIKLYFSGK
ncbi:MAG: hypothetical protein IJ019_06415 [Alphaproteobacteria bacterium]|nr:hypothetical protein [Alphaproteobacteria bacterium]